jgi:hypothetical protein
MESRTVIQFTRNILVKGFIVNILSESRGMKSERENAGAPGPSYELSVGEAPSGSAEVLRG